MPKRDILAEMTANEDRYRAAREEELQANPAYRAMLALREKKIFVRPAAGQSVPTLTGGYFPEEGIEVPAGNVYVHRRLRDGSLERADKPSAQQSPAPVEPPPPPAPEPTPQEEPAE